MWRRVPHKDTDGSVPPAPDHVAPRACQSPGTSALTSKEQKEIPQQGPGHEQSDCQFLDWYFPLRLDKGAGTWGHLSGPLKPVAIVQPAMQERGWRVSDLEQDDTSEVTPTACEHEGPGQACRVLSLGQPAGSALAGVGGGRPQGRGWSFSSPEDSASRV